MYEILCNSGLQWCIMVLNRMYSVKYTVDIKSDIDIQIHINACHGLLCIRSCFSQFIFCFVHAKNIAYNTGQENTLEDWKPCVYYDSSSSTISSNVSSSIRFSCFIATLTFAQSLRTELPLPGYTMLLITLPGLPRPRN